MHERNESMVSMKDVAVECGVSIATVSKALNDHSDISEETRRKVKEAANRLGYYPNSAARALKTNRSYNIGVLLNNGLAHEYFAEVLESFKNEAEKKGYDITFVSKFRSITIPAITQIPFIYLIDGYS